MITHYMASQLKTNLQKLSNLLLELTGELGARVQRGDLLLGRPELRLEVGGDHLDDLLVRAPPAPARLAALVAAAF